MTSRLKPAPLLWVAYQIEFMRVAINKRAVDRQRLDSVPDASESLRIVAGRSGPHRTCSPCLRAMTRYPSNLTRAASQARTAASRPEHAGKARMKPGGLNETEADGKRARRTR